MGFIKKRLFLIISMVFFLVGIGIFVYGFSVSGDNDQGYTKVKSKYDQARGLDRTLVPDNERSQYKTNADAAMRDAQTVVKLATEATRRTLISEDVFPEPTGLSPDIKYQKFAQSYVDFVENYLAMMQAGPRPSMAEEDKVRQEHLERPGGNRAMPGANRSAGRSTSQADKLIDDLRRTRSEEITVYADPSVFCGYDYWKEHDATGDRETLLLDTWFTQLAHWIQEDVVLSIKAINGDSAKVADSPVKRLIEVSFGGSDLGSGVATTNKKPKTTRRPSAQMLEGVSRRNAGSENQLPEYVQKLDGEKNSESEDFIGTITTPWTRRASNELIDVAHFEVAVVIDSSYVTDFINLLQSEKATTVIEADGTTAAKNKRNQITVLQLQQEPLDVDSEMEAGYFYGQGSLTTLRLVCEYIFFRQGYARLMPEPVKELFEQES